MSGAARVGLLTTPDHPLLPYFLEHLDAHERIEPVLIFDEQPFSERDIAIFADRTHGAFPPRDAQPYFERHQTFSVPSHNDDACVEFIKANDIALLYNAGTPRILKAPMLEAAKLGSLQVHPGVLPKYRGSSCCEWAIHHDDPVGVTAHYMDAKLDSGPIISSRVLAVRRGQPYHEVRIGLYRLQHHAALDAIEMVLASQLRPGDLEPQPPAETFRPIPDELLAGVKEKLLAGEYAWAF